MLFWRFSSYLRKYFIIFKKNYCPLVPILRQAANRMSELSKLERYHEPKIIYLVLINQNRHSSNSKLIFELFVLISDMPNKCFEKYTRRNKHNNGVFNWQSGIRFRQILYLFRIRTLTFTKFNAFRMIFSAFRLPIENAIKQIDCHNLISSRFRTYCFKRV